MHDTVTKITNIKAYMVTALYNAPSTMNHYYQQEVQHDMYGGGWDEKGIVCKIWKDFCGDNKYIHRQLLDRVSRGG